MPSLGRIFLWVAALGLIGLGVGVAIGVAFIIVPVAALAVIGWVIYKRTSSGPRYDPRGG
jgi:hypothetical protein